MWFEQINRFPQDFAQVGAIDLVDVQKVVALRIFGRGLGSLHQKARRRGESEAERGGAVVVRDGRESSNEVLVGGVGVELDGVAKAAVGALMQSEERRVGKECRSRWS